MWEDRREHEEQERMVADDHPEGAPLRRAARGIGPSARDVTPRNPIGERGQGKHAEPQVLPVTTDQQEAAERRPDRDPEIGRDPDRRVRSLALLRADEVGDHRLVGGTPERAEDREQGEQRQAGGDVVADREQAERNERSAPFADQDQRPTADPIRGVAAEVAGDG